MTLVADLVLQTANAPGEGTFFLIAPVAGRRSFMQGAGAGKVFYFAHDGTNWEEGDGTVTAGSPDTLRRDTVYINSLGTTNTINFTGLVNVYSDIPAARAFWADASGVYQAQNRRIANLAPAAVQTDALRWDQAGGVKVAAYSVFGGLITIPFVNGTDIHEIELYNVGIADPAVLFMRVSVDGGSTFLASPSEYFSSVKQHSAFGGYTTQSREPGIYAALSQTVSANWGVHGLITVFPSLRQFRSHLYGNSAAGLTNDDAGGVWSTTTTPTHLQIGGVLTSVTSGGARLVRKG